MGEEQNQSAFRAGSGDNLKTLNAAFDEMISSGVTQVKLEPNAPDFKKPAKTEVVPTKATDALPETSAGNTGEKDVAAPSVVTNNQEVQGSVDENLSDEEKARREEQSWKDKYYSVQTEAEKTKQELQRIRETEVLQSQNKVVQEARVLFEREIEPMVKLAQRKYAQYQNALARQEVDDLDPRAIEELRQEYELLRGNVLREEDKFQGAVRNHEQKIVQERVVKQESFLEEQFKKLDPELSLSKLLEKPELAKERGNLLKIVEVAIDEATKKHKTRIKELEKQVESARTEARKEWERESPGSVAKIAGSASNSPKVTMGSGKGRANLSSAISEGLLG